MENTAYHRSHENCLKSRRQLITPCERNGWRANACVHGMFGGGVHPLLLILHRDFQINNKFFVCILMLNFFKKKDISTSESDVCGRRNRIYYTLYFYLKINYSVINLAFSEKLWASITNANIKKLECTIDFAN